MLIEILTYKFYRVTKKTFIYTIARFFKMKFDLEYEKKIRNWKHLKKRIFTQNIITRTDFNILS